MGPLSWLHPVSRSGQWVLLLLALSAVAVSIGANLQLEYTSVVAFENERLATQARVIDENLSRQLAATHASLDSIRRDLPFLSDQKDSHARINRRLNSIREAMPGIRALTIFDASGTLTARSPDQFVGQNFRQRDYFTIAEAGGDPRVLYVAPPFMAATKEFVLNMSKVIQDGRGQFDGIILASLNPEYFTTLLNSVRYSQDMWAALVHGDGKSFLVTPARAGAEGMDLTVPGSIFSWHRDSGRSVNTLRGITQLTGEDSTIALRSIRPASVPMDKPIVLAVARPQAGILAAWRQNAFRQGFMFVLLAMITTLALHFLQLRKAAYERLARQQGEERSRAAEAMRIAATVFDSQEGMMVTDARGIILSVNRAFCENTGYSPEEIVGQRPSILKSGHHDDAFYREMWGAINANGSWQGEIWDKRKNGEIYPKWLTISAVKSDDGIVTHYVGTQFDITERKQAEERIRELAFFDQLTGLSNRFSLNERLAQALNMAEREREQLAVMLIDLDNFKAVNDSLGHAIGDRLLVETGRRLLDSVRQSDLVARLGGDEFVVVLPAVDQPIDVANVAEKILANLRHTYLIDGHPLHTSPSIGICFYPDDATDREDLLKKADVAMYQAKAAGKANFQFFKKEFQEQAMKRLNLEAELRVAIEQQQFVLHYQPQLDLRSGLIYGLEALVRWQHPTRGLVSPGEFIAIVEETGLIVPLGDWVVDEACRQLAVWRREGLPALRMSVNLSALQFADAHLPDRIREVLERHDLAGHAIDLEITESMAMSSPDRTATLLRRLADQGHGLSIDDFGTGYSSLAYLKQFPLDTLKIDRSFVKDIRDGASDTEICEVSILLAHKLGMQVVAEGVETQDQLEVLRGMHCEKVQGYLISRPLPAADLPRFLLGFAPLHD